MLLVSLVFVPSISTRRTSLCGSRLRVDNTSRLGSCMPRDTGSFVSRSFSLADPS